MKAIVMAGGFGTRLRPLTINTPKPMVPIGNIPMMEHVVGLLARHGLADVTSLLYFQPESIRGHFGDGAAVGVRMSYEKPADDLGTAGAVRYAVGDTREPVLVISGDLVTNFDLAEAIAWHRQKEADATVLLTRVENPIAYGIVITDDDGRIVRFLEKPTWGEAFSDTINTGIYILEPQAVELIPKDENFDFSQNLFPLMLKKGMKLCGKIMAGYWKDVGNVDEYFRAHFDLFGGDLKLDLKAERQILDQAVIHRGRNVHLGQGTRFSGTILLGDDVHVGDGSALHNCALGQRVRIGAGCSLKDTVVWADTTIGGQCRFSRALVCARVQIGDNVELADHAIISDDCVVGDDATVRANCKIWPGKRVDESAIVSSSLVWGDAWNRELFTDSKITGLALTEITPEMAVKVGAAFGATLGPGAAVVTSREVSDVAQLLRRSMMAGLLASGVNVYDLETLPVPVVRYALRKGEYAAGIYARHNPVDYRYLDFIFFHGSALDMPPSQLKKVERNYFGEDFQRASINDIGHLDYPQGILRDYQADFMSEVDAEIIKEAGFKIVVDYAHGSSSEVFPDLFSRLGISTTELNSHPNPKKSSVPPEESARAIVQLSAIVRSLNADVGFRINPAAEKLTVVDENGRPLDDQILLMIVTELYLQTHHPKRIAVPVAATMGIEEIAERYGVEVVRVTNDHQAMMKIHNSGGADFVGGTRGGFIFSRFHSGADAMFALIHILEMLAQTRGRLSHLRTNYEHLVRQTVTVPCPWSRKGMVMRRLITESANKRRQLIDGVRILEDDGWVLIAPDRFNAAFSIFAESTSRKTTESLIRNYRTVVETCQDSQK
ncbi:MAG: sugar phosphate nucleotidyltransferase [Candidatus Zixiibacteriota bacterium]